MTCPNTVYLPAAPAAALRLGATAPRAGAGARCAPGCKLRTVQRGQGLEGDEELRAVGVWARVGHGQRAAPGVLQGLHQLVRELAVGCRVDALAALAGACGARSGWAGPHAGARVGQATAVQGHLPCGSTCGVAALHHEPVRAGTGPQRRGRRQGDAWCQPSPPDQPVEQGAIILAAGAQRQEVLCCARHLRTRSRVRPPAAGRSSSPSQICTSSQKISHFMSPILVCRVTACKQASQGRRGPRDAFARPCPRLAMLCRPGPPAHQQGISLRFWGQPTWAAALSLLGACTEGASQRKWPGRAAALLLPGKEPGPGAAWPPVAAAHARQLLTA